MLSDMKYKSGSIFFCLVVAITISCGSTHLMMPPHQLRYKEFQANFAVSYDLNRAMRLPNIGFNFYWGAGKDYVIGTAYQPPFGIPHLTAIKYIEENANSDRYLYASLHGLLLTYNYMPKIELGGGLNDWNGSHTHSFSTGIAINFDYKPLIFYEHLLNSKPGLPVITWPTFYPFIKYQYSYKDLRLSIQNYIGLTESIATNFRRKREKAEIFKISYADIDSVFCSQVWYRGYTIKLKDGNGYIISPRSNHYPDEWFPIYIVFENRFKMGSETAYYYLIYYQNLDCNESSDYNLYGIYEIDISALLDDYENGKDLIFQNEKANTELIKKQIKWYLHDWSVGLGIQTESR